MNRRRHALAPWCFLLLFFVVPSLAEEGETSPQIDPALIPSYIAVMPALGDKKLGDLSDIRLAIHNILGASDYELMKPSVVDERLSASSHYAEEENLDYKKIAEELGVDGLIIINVDDIEKVNVGAYAHYKIALTNSLYSGISEEFIWSDTDTETQREGGISTSPIGILVTVINSARLLRDAIRLQLIDVLARRFADKIPQPDRLLAKPEPPKIEQVIANAVDGPFNEGKEIRVVMQAEPGLKAQFRFSHDDRRHPMNEIKEGEYHGRYVVAKNENHADSRITLLIQKERDPLIEWPVAGIYSMDTEAPADVSQLTGIAQTASVDLKWLSDANEPQLRFEVERADADSGQFVDLQTVDVNSFSDTTLQMGKTYLYRITPVDLAGNRGGSSTTRIITVRYGPTPIVDDIKSNLRLTASGSPYRLNKAVTVLKNVRLTIEPGAVLELGDQAVIDVQGELEALGSKESPIVIKGGSWRIVHDFQQSGKNHYKHVSFVGEDSMLEWRASEGLIQHSSFANAGMYVDKNAKVALQHSRLQQSDTALTVIDSEASLQNVEFADNNLALLVDRSEVALEKIHFWGNEHNIDSKSDITVKNSQFDSGSYPDLLEKLQGNITIDWSSFATENNLIKRWLEAEWPKIAAGIERRDWLAARRDLSSIQKHLPDQAFEDLSEVLYSQKNPAALLPELDNAPLLDAFARAREEDKRALLVWLPEELGDNAFQTRYMERHFAKELSEGFLTTERLNLADSILETLPMTRAKEQNIELGQFYLVDQENLDGQLRQEGFIRRSALYNQAEVISPRYPQLCRTPNPWVAGEHTVEADASSSPRCFAIRVRSEDNSEIFVLAESEGKIRQLLPDSCQQTGVLSNRMVSGQVFAIPQNNNRQAAVIAREKWPYERFLLVAVEGRKASDFAQQVLNPIPSACAEDSAPVDAEDLVRQLRIADKQLGGHLQWSSLILP